MERMIKTLQLENLGWKAAMLDFEIWICGKP